MGLTENPSTVAGPEQARIRIIEEFESHKLFNQKKFNNHQHKKLFHQ